MCQAARTNGAAGGPFAHPLFLTVKKQVDAQTSGELDKCPLQNCICSDSVKGIFCPISPRYTTSAPEYMDVNTLQYETLTLGHEAIFS